MTLPRLHTAQQEIKTNAARFNVVNCGRRFGKSTLGEDLACIPALEGFPVGWFSPDYKSLLEVWRELCIRLRPVISRKSEQEKRIELITGGVIEFWALDADPECSRGRKYKRVIVDEAAKVRYLMRAWLEAIRANLADYEGDAWFFSTPKGRNDYWELYQRGADDDKHEWRCWKKPTGDNPFILTSEIEAMRQEMGPRISSQEIDAEFLEVGGRFFDGWDEEKHTGILRQVEPHWRFFAGLDFGTYAPFAFVLCATDESNTVHVIDECYQSGLLPTDQSKLVLKCLEANGVDKTRCLIAADPSMFPSGEAERRVGEKPIEAFWRAGLSCIKADNDRVAGWTRIKEWLHLPKGSLVCYKGRTSNLIRTFPLQVYDERPNHENDMDSLGDDHLLDALRYALMTRPQPAKAKQSPTNEHLERFKLIPYHEEEAHW